MEESILTSIKKLLGIAECYKHFDVDLIIHINSVFAELTQMGVGPAQGYAIVDEYNTWSDYLQNDTRLNEVKSYIYLKVKKIFDPPASSVMMESLNKLLDEYSFRLYSTSNFEDN